MHDSDLISHAFENARRLGLPFPVCHIARLQPMSILDWVRSSSTDQKWYWRSRDNSLECGGVGAAITFSPDSDSTAVEKANRIIASFSDTSLAFLWARRFDSNRPSDVIWKSFPDEVAVLPRDMIIRRNSDYIFIRSTAVRPDNDQGHIDDSLTAHDVHDVPQPATAVDFSLPTFLGYDNFPDNNRWKDNVRLCLEAIKDGRIIKVVPARRRDYRTGAACDPLAMLTALLKTNGNCFGIGFQPEPKMGFISISPERLYRRHESVLEIEAVSSTVPRGSTPDDDLRLQKELEQSDKQRREHRIVIDSIVETIMPLCDHAPEIASTVVMKLLHLQHLHTRITGQLKNGIADHVIIEALHPTPAVGGYPRQMALDMIADLDGFDRGWYAGPIGCITSAGMECAVGIRSALISENRLSVFAGAGIVDGSDADAEWRELDSKDILQPLLSERKLP